VALAVTTFLLEEAGATPEQVDRERDRVRQALAENAAGGRANAPFGS
jgi:hypothetical protein